MADAPDSGFEPDPAQIAPPLKNEHEAIPREPEIAPVETPVGKTSGNQDPVEAALALALTEAAKAGRFDVVAQLARELEARRLAGTQNVVSFDAKRGRR